MPPRTGRKAARASAADAGTPEASLQYRRRCQIKDDSLLDLPPAAQRPTAILPQRGGSSTAAAQRKRRVAGAGS